MPTNVPGFTYTAPPEDMLSPMWTLRLVPALVLISLVLAEFSFTTGSVHSALLGFGIGQLIVFIVVCFQITSVTMSNDQTRSDVQDLHITG